MPSRKDSKPPERQNFQDAGAGPLNWGVGTFWCTPKLIAKSPVKDNSKGKQSRKKGGGKPRCSAVYVICKGPIQGVTRILANGKVMYDIRPSVTNRDFLSGLSSAWRVVNGTQTSPDPTLVSILGASLAASLNGWALLVFENLQVKDSGGDVPTFECEVLRYPKNGFTPINISSDIASIPYRHGDPSAGGAVPITYLDSGTAPNLTGEIQRQVAGVANIFEVSMYIPSRIVTLARLFDLGITIPPTLDSQWTTRVPFMSASTALSNISSVPAIIYSSATLSLKQGGLYYHDNNLATGYSTSGAPSAIPYDFTQPGEAALLFRFSGFAINTATNGLFSIAITSLGFTVSASVPVIAEVAGSLGSVQPPSAPTAIISRAFTASGSVLGSSSVQTLQWASLTTPFYFRWVLDSGVAIDPPSQLAGYTGTSIAANTTSTVGNSVSNAAFFLRQGSKYFRPIFGSGQDYSVFDWFGPMQAYVRSGNEFVPSSGSFSTGSEAQIWAQVDVVGPFSFNIGGPAQVTVSYPPNLQLHHYNAYIPGAASLRSSAYYSPFSKTVTGKVVQCQDGIERLFSVTTSARVYGASITYQTGAGISNVAGDVALEAEGSVVVETSAGPITALPYSRGLGSWYYTGAEVSPGVWEVARQSEVAPYIVWDTALAGETYATSPPSIFGDFYPVPSVPTRSLRVARALHNQPLSLNDIHRQLLADFPDSVGQWYEQIEGVTDPRTPSEALFYGWTIDGQGTVFDSYSRLLASLGIDLVDNYGQLNYISDNNRALTLVQDDWVSRKYDDETGDEEPFYTYEIMPNSVAPDEVRLMFRDAGRDGEESLAYYRSPLFSETQNSETISTNAVMAFATAQTLAFRLFARTATRGKKYTVRLNYRAFGAIDVGSLIQFRVVDCDRPIWDLATNSVSVDRRGWVAERVVTLLVSEVQIDELFNLEIVGYEYLTNSVPQPVITPGDLLSGPDGFPNEILMQANVVDTPIWDGSTNTLQKFYQAIPLAPNTEVITPCETAMSTLGGTYVVLDNDTPGDLFRTGSLTGGAPILGVIDEKTILTFSGVASEGFGSVSESLFLSGQGTWIKLGAEVVRAKNLVWTGTQWQASYLMRGLLGTSFASIGVSLPVTLLSKLKSKPDGAQDLAVSRDVRTYAQIQAIDSSPAKQFTQNGFTAAPYPPTNLGNDLQPNGDRILYWMGHGLSNGNAINGQKPLNIAIGQSYTITLIGASGTFTSLTQGLTLTSTQLGAATGFTVRQNGDFNLFSPSVSLSF
jgi:Putative phage tail protein